MLPCYPPAIKRVRLRPRLRRPRQEVILYVLPAEGLFPLREPADVTRALSSYQRHYRGPTPFPRFATALVRAANLAGPRFAARLPSEWRP